MRSLNVYVAAKFIDREQVREIHSLLRKMGHTVALDWTNHEKDSLMDKVHWATEDINGVRNCDVLIAVFIQERHQRGAMIEIGAALGLGKPVIIAGNAENSSTLLNHPLVTKKKDIVEALNAIRQINIGESNEKSNRC